VFLIRDKGTSKQYASQEHNTLSNSTVGISWKNWENIELLYVLFTSYSTWTIQISSDFSTMLCQSSMICQSICFTSQAKKAVLRISKNIWGFTKWNQLLN